MRRRTILATVGTTVALAGCVSDAPDGGETANGTADDRNGDGSDRFGIATDGGPILDQFDTEPERPECERKPKRIDVERGGETDERETVETIPYPGPPATFADDAIVDFAAAFDRAYVTHDVLCGEQRSGEILDVGYSIRESETFDRYDDLTTVFLLRAGGATSGVDDNGNEWAASLGFSGVVYAVDRTGVARADFDDAPALDGGEFESRAPDPLDTGILVAAFD